MEHSLANDRIIQTIRFLLSPFHIVSWTCAHFGIEEQQENVNKLKELNAIANSSKYETGQK